MFMLKNTFKIEVVKLIEDDDKSKYPQTDKIYEQVIEDLDVQELALFLNKKD